MSSSTIRRGGLALIANGAIFAVAQIFHPPDADPGALTHPLWSPLHLAVAIAFGIGIIGVLGLGAAQAAGTGRLGRVALVLALFGTGISAVASLVEVILPGLVAGQPGPQSLTALLDPAGPLPWVLPIFLLTLLGFLLGYGLLGIALARAGALPRWAGVALTVTTVVHLVAPSPLIKSASGAAFGVALIWLGVALAQRQRPAASARTA